jgi:glutamate-1-semialdehyde aminotransferase/acyl carrier protein
MTAPFPVDPAPPPLLEPIRSLFADLFGVPGERLLPDASFLELGADSLLLLRASQRIEETFGARIPFRRLVEELSSVEAVAAYLAAATGGRVEASRLAAVPDSDPLPVPAAPTLPAGAPSRAARPEPSADLRALFSEQLRLLDRQLDLLAREARPAPVEPVPTPPGAPSVPLHLAPAARFVPVTAAGVPGGVGAPGAAFVPYRPIDRSPGSTLTSRQREHLDELISRLAAKTHRSRELTEAYRGCLANNRAVSGFRLLWKELVYPLVGHRGAGARIWDVDGNEYLDLTMGFGSLLFGHSPDFLDAALRRQLDLGIQIGPESETAGRVAELVRELTGVERVTFSNSGTEAVMIALRLARAVTGRTRIALFAGAFHGTFDGVLARRETGADGRARVLPMAPGVPPHLVEDLLVLDYESEESLAAVEAHAGELAAVLVEPVQSRRPELLNGPLLRRLRAITERAGIALIFDEVVTGFRVHSGGVQALFGVEADLVTYGKAVANGMPIGIVAGKAKYLDAIDGGDWRYGDRSLPEAEITLFGGTFFRHPLVMAAALAVLERLRANPGLQAELSEKTERLAVALDEVFAVEGFPGRIVRFGSLFTFRFPLEWWASNLLFFHLLLQGIYIWEGRICYLSTAHTPEDLEQIVAAFRASLRELRQGGFLPGTEPEERRPTEHPDL